MHLIANAGFHQIVNGDGGAHWWDETNSRLPNFASFERYLSALTTSAQRNVFVWQVPIGNTLMRSENNTWNHYQDNRVQYWLGGYPSDGHLASLARSGVVGILWGRGADGGTSFEDSARDGITNPPPINGNDRQATVADDDGGYLRERMRAYKSSPLSLTANSLAAPLATPSASTTVANSTVGTPVAATPTPRQVAAAVAVAMARTSKKRITFRVTPIGGPASVHVELDGKAISRSVRVASPTAKRPSTTITLKGVTFTSGGHSVTFLIDSGRATITNVKVS